MSATLVPTLAETLAEWASGVRRADLPDHVVAQAASQLLSQVAAARAARCHPVGQRVVAAFGAPMQHDPKRAAYVLAALTTCLDFDDTMYAGHVSHSTVGVPLAYARALRLTGAQLLTAVVVANECAARLTAAATLGPFRGQTAAHAHLAGAVAARLHAEGAPASLWTSAWGLAFAAPPWSLQRAFLGSDAKVFAAATPIQTALDACDAAAAGMLGAVDVWEHPEGFLARFAEVALPDAVTAGLGQRWHTETLSYKAYPACAYAGAALDCAVALHRMLGELHADEVVEIVVHAPIFAVAMEHAAAAYLTGPDSPLPALSFTVGYNVATALLTGDLTSADLAEPAVRDARRWAVAEKVKVVYDETLSQRAVLATAPLGEALRQAADRAEPWLRAMAGEPGAALAALAGPPVTDFHSATKLMGARVVVRLADGRVVEQSREQALGAAGPATRRDHGALMREKWLRCGGSPDVADAILTLDELSPAQVAQLVVAALDAA